jgi:hypothetical protein
MRTLLEILIFPIFIAWSVFQALIAKPLHFSYSKNRGLEIGIVPLAVIIFITFLISKYL